MKELRDMKIDLVHLKERLSSSKGQLDTSMKSLQELEVKTFSRESTLREMQDCLVAYEDNIEYLENISRRNNAKPIRIPENEREVWDESEEIFISQENSA